MAMSCAAVLLGGALVSAQDPPPQTTPPPRWRAGGQFRPNLPDPSTVTTPADVQNWIDTYALIEAEKVLQLTGDQYPNFVVRHRMLATVRRRAQMDRNRTVRELNLMVQNGAKDEAIVEKLKALDDIQKRSFEEVRKAHMDLDAVLSPSQRVRFRIFEDRLEQQKIKLLNMVNPGRGRGGQDPQGTGRKGGGFR